MYKKAKYFILLAIITASSAIGVISLPQTASAATSNLYLAPEIKTAAKQSALRVSLALCLEIYRGGNLNGDPPFQTSASNIAKGDWFQNDEEPKVRAGYIVDPDNGTVECRNLFEDRNVAKDLGFNSNIALACAIGLTRTDGSDCLTGNGKNFTSDSTDKDKIYKALKGGFNNAQYYVMAATTYLVACGGKAVTNVSDASIDQKNNDDYDTVKVVTGTGQIVDVLYTKKNNGEKAFRNFEDSFDYKVENCEWMVEEMNRTATAYRDWVKAHPAEDGDNAGSGVVTDDDEEEAEKSTCSVAGVGWIICPIVNNLLAPITDAAYAFVASLLTVQPLTMDGTNQIYQAWTVMRDFANVAFVIAFLLIVFSQLTNIGINNYGIKKMLPRLILAAILVNVSYWICAIAVDLSNIAGASMRGLFAGTAGNITIPDGGTGSTAEGAAGWVSLAATGLVATGAALYIGLSALLPALIIVLFTILIVAIVLLIRQVLIVLLIVVSPLAFVAYLLPNTESLFTKWRKLFGNLLLLFPIVGIIFGASELASKVITAAAPSTEYSFAFQVMGAATAVVPLVLVPTMIKGAKAFGGVLGGRIGSVLNNPNKGPFDRARKRAEQYRGYRQNSRSAAALSGGKVIGAGHFKRGYRKDLRNKSAEDSLRSAQGQFNVTDNKASQYAQSSALSNAQANALNSANNTRLVSNIASNPGLVSSGMGTASDDEHVKKALDSQQQRAVADAIKDVELSAEIAPGDISAMGTMLENALKSGDTITARAMQNMMLQSGNPGVDAYRSKMIAMEGQQNAAGQNVLNDTVMSDMRQNVLSNHSKIKASAADIMKQATSGGNLSDHGKSASTWKLADAELATQKASSMNLALDAKDASGNFAVDKAQAERILDNPDLAKSIASDEIRRKLLARAGRPVPPAPTPPTPPTPPGTP
ncbi:hypothetical protein PV379_03405 [Streptomyces caniscabiei]|uniref:hypothetical protein n=1 Tax=Streptomyces caniscabiei TaxID=2746961 RepID=UPI0029BC66B6|nr:hypothetical protein [Streptomyces caniscabiei]MDX2776386.1 hypothetical protein [Streptomyces caniscabiei]